MTDMTYPVTPTVDVVDDYHGTLVADPYRWLEDTDAEATRAWIAEQNRLTHAWLDEVADRDRIRDRLQALWDFPRAGVPSSRGGRWFQWRNTGLQNQDVLFVMEHPDDEGRVLLDPNVLSEDGTVAVTAAAVSRDGRLLAYARSEAGSDWMTWRVRDIVTGEDLPDEVRWAKFAPAVWLPDGSGFVYGGYPPPPEGSDVLEAANRGHRLLLHRLGEPDDEVVHERPDRPDWLFSPEITEDGRWLVIEVAEGTERRNRVHVRDLGAGLDAPTVPLLDRADGAYRFVGNEDEVFYFLTDAGAERGRIVAVDVRDPDPARWREVVPEHPEHMLDDARIVGLVLGRERARLVVHHLEHARSRLTLLTLDGEPAGEVALPGIGAVTALAGRPDDTLLHLQFVTFTQPPSVYRYDVERDRASLVRQPAIDADPERFTVEQEFFTSADGTRVPAFLVHRRDVAPTGDVPTLLVGYGGFNIPLTPAFSVWTLVWVEMGGVLAVANLRGGGEYGSAWHDAGRLANKQNVFDDCIAVAQGLMTRGWTRPDRLALLGGSNGGLLVGACMTQRPDLFGACVPEVGVLDMLRFHHFTIGWAWTSDYGSADDPEQFRWLHAYSPLHNLAEGVEYPATLVVTGDHDDRVVPGHSFKFAAALQRVRAGANGGAVDPRRPALIRVQTDAGHGAGKPVRFQVEERADVLAFLVRALDVRPLDARALDVAPDAPGASATAG